MFTPSPITLPRGGIFAIPVNIATPPPPVLFSAMMFQPVWSFITLARTRPIVSVDPPAPKPICRVSGPSGFQPAMADPATIIVTTADMAAHFWKNPISISISRAFVHSPAGHQPDERPTPPAQPQDRETDTGTEETAIRRSRHLTSQT